MAVTIADALAVIAETLDTRLAAVEARLTALEGAQPAPEPEPIPEPQPEPEPIPEPEPAPGPTDARVIPWPVAGQAAWRDVLPVQPSAGWMTGEGYAELRDVVFAQWHDSEQQNLDAMRHIHVEIAMPRVVRTSTLLLEARCVLFHWQGGMFAGIRKTPTRGFLAPVILPNPTDKDPGAFDIPIPEGPAGHIAEFYVPILYDLTACPSPGWCLFEIDMDAWRPDMRKANARLQMLIWVDPTGTTEPSPYYPGLADWPNPAAEGWVSSADDLGNQFGYMTIQSFGGAIRASDPPAAVGQLAIKPGGIEGRTLQLKVMKNPNLHLHPPSYGEVLLEQTFVMPAQIKLGSTFRAALPSLVPGDKVLMRIADANEPNIGAGATLVGWRVGAP